MKKIKMLVTSLLLLMVAISALSATNGLATINLNDLKLLDFSIGRPSFENIPVKQLQVKIKINNHKANAVWVQLNKKDRLQLLKPNNRVRSRYAPGILNIKTRYIKTIKDIQFLKLVLQSKNVADLKEVEILVNGVSILKKNYYSEGNRIKANTLKYKSSVILTSYTLRNHPNWKYNKKTAGIYESSNDTETNKPCRRINRKGTQIKHEVINMNGRGEREVKKN